jgi:hypothetical protein
MAELVKLKVTPCTIDDGMITVKDGQAFTLMLNPSKYSRSYEISYSERKSYGQVGSQVRFHAISDETINFEVMLDGTGVAGDAAPDVATQVRKLNQVVYNYQGNEHEPNHVQLLWGSFIFFGRLTSMSANYSLFKPSGDPLRAVLTLAFRGFMTEKEESLAAKRTSPDLTHIVEVQAGDTLPLLCHRIYKDASYYPEVARFNNLVNLRDLAPGLRLQFPPLV